MIGQRIGNYEIETQIGEGGMGAVYAARHTLIDKFVAVKVLLPQYSRDAEIVSRFFNEAKAATLIRHPGIVELFDYGHLPDGSAYIVMERLAGESLEARVARRGRLSVNEAVTLTASIADILSAAHSHGIIHRDLKPDNVFLVPDPAVIGGERPKLLDFGIAKLAGDSAAFAGGSGVQTRTGVVMGTPVYMSPEQCRGAGQVDHRADIYSLGCILYQLLCGVPPFVGEGVGEIIAAHIYSQPPDPRSLEPEVTAELAAVVARSLAKEPSARVGSMADFAVALRRLGSGSIEPELSRYEPQAAGYVAAGVTTTLGGAAGQAVVATMSPTTERRGLLWPTVAVAALLIGGGGYSLSSGGSTSGGEPRPVVAAKSAPAPAPQAQPELAAELEPTMVSVRIASDPPGAEVYRVRDGVLLGHTPWERSEPTGAGELQLIIKKAGYAETSLSISLTSDSQRKLELTALPDEPTSSRRERSGRRRRSSQAPPPPRAAPDVQPQPKRAGDGALDPFAE